MRDLVLINLPITYDASENFTRFLSVSSSDKSFLMCLLLRVPSKVFMLHILFSTELIKQYTAYL